MVGRQWNSQEKKMMCLLINTHVGCGYKMTVCGFCNLKYKMKKTEVKPRFALTKLTEHLQAETFSDNPLFPSITRSAWSSVGHPAKFPPITCSKSRVPKIGNSSKSGLVNTSNLSLPVNCEGLLMYWG